MNQTQYRLPQQEQGLSITVVVTLFAVGLTTRLSKSPSRYRADGNSEFFIAFNQGIRQGSNIEVD